MNGLLEVEIWTVARTEEGNVVLLRPLSDVRVIPIFIGSLEGQSITLGLDGVKTERPLTHDLFLTMTDHAGFSVIRAEIVDMKGEVFYSRLCFSGQGYTVDAPLVLDARPSDALALAVRRRCPVYVTTELLEKAGNSMDMIMNGKIRSPKSLLKRELDEAVAAEEYERAAQLRDKLNMLEKDEESMYNESGR
jgi:bifunctional DNase/RNase